jgi:hypothetical protein
MEEWDEERRPEGGRSGTCEKIVTQPREEVCDLGGAGSGASETEQRGEEVLAGKVAVRPSRSGRDPGRGSPGARYRTNDL